MKKIGAFTLGKLQDSYENDPKKNFDLRIKMKKGLIKKQEEEEEEAKQLSPRKGA